MGTTLFFLLLSVITTTTMCYTNIEEIQYEKSKTPKWTYNCQGECLDNGDILADPNDCNVYYVCSAAGPFYQSCNESKPYFDGTACQMDPTRCCDMCTSYCTPEVDGLDIIDPFDCSAYYSCQAEGTPSVHGSCSDGQIFDSNNHVCVVGTCEPYCDDTTAATGDTTTVETTSDTSQDTTTPTLSTTPVPPAANCSLETICIDEFDGRTVSDPYNCDQYYYCQDQIILLPVIKCENSTVYNGTDCVEETVPCVPDCAHYCPTTCKVDVEYIPDASNCSVFYHCNFELTPNSCTEQSPYFNGEVCVDDPTECCSTCTPYCTADDVSEYVADPKDCTAYYFCVGEGVPTMEGTCPAGQIFYNGKDKCIDGSCDDYCT